MNFYLAVIVRSAVIVGAYAGVRYVLHRNVVKNINDLPVEQCRPKSVKAA